MIAYIMEKEKLLQSVLEKVVDRKKIFGTTFALKKNDEFWIGASGNISKDQPFFIASTTKLFTTAIILRLQSEEKLNLDDNINKYLSHPILNGLHIYKGKEYSNQLTIKHLLAHTSGLPDYFQNKGKKGRSLEDEIKNGHDQYWTFEQCIERTKSMKPFS